MIKNLIKKAYESGISAILITNDNLHDYLDENTLKRIDYAV